MRKIQPRNIHSAAHKVADHFLGIARRANGADDLRPPGLCVHRVAFSIQHVRCNLNCKKTQNKNPAIDE
jgi:hypothetical protein